MTLCRLCVYPDTRPDANFLDGVCSGCRSYAERQYIDWNVRRKGLVDALKTCQIGRNAYDCIVPVSGGKDSTYQVLTLRDMGAKVLAVNAGTDYLTDIGRRNLDNLKHYCDVLELTPNIEVRKKLMRIGLRLVGDLSYPEHLAIWSIPMRVACAFHVPLVVWGEQPQREYACPEGVPPATRLTSRWVAEFGGLLGLRLDDVVGQEGLTARDLDVFRFPSDATLDDANVMGIWLGDYIDWDGWKNAFIAQQYGFEVLSRPVETSLANYENLDNYVTVLRDHLRWLKYGYTRATDIACSHIRRGRLSRDEALRLVEHAGYAPLTSLGKPIDEVLAYIGISTNEWQRECEKWASQSE
jgi:N-acetyl sugar amidotransferase